MGKGLKLKPPKKHNRPETAYLLIENCWALGKREQGDINVICAWVQIFASAILERPVIVPNLFMQSTRNSVIAALDDVSSDEIEPLLGSHDTRRFLKEPYCQRVDHVATVFEYDYVKHGNPARIQWLERVSEHTDMPPEDKVPIRRGREYPLPGKPENLTTQFGCRFSELLVAQIEQRQLAGRESAAVLSGNGVLLTDIPKDQLQALLEGRTRVKAENGDAISPRTIVELAVSHSLPEVQRRSEGQADTVKLEEDEKPIIKVETATSMTVKEEPATHFLVDVFRDLENGEHKQEEGDNAALSVETTILSGVQEDEIKVKGEPQPVSLSFPSSASGEDSGFRIKPEPGTGPELDLKSAFAGLNDITFDPESETNSSSQISHVKLEPRDDLQRFPLAQGLPKSVKQEGEGTMHVKQENEGRDHRKRANSEDEQVKRVRIKLEPE